MFAGGGHCCQRLEDRELLSRPIGLDVIAQLHLFDSAYLALTFAKGVQLSIVPWSTCLVDQ